MQLIESWGTGIRRMIASCREYGLREPGFMEIGDSFRVELYRPSYKKSLQQEEQTYQKSRAAERMLEGLYRRLEAVKSFVSMEIWLSLIRV